jgi:hypothetical protein
MYVLNELTVPPGTLSMVRQDDAAAVATDEAFCHAIPAALGCDPARASGP